MGRRGLFIAILVYVALDLSMAEMPGAFVFDLAESVEGTARAGRSQITADFAASLPPTGLFPTLAEPSREPVVRRVAAQRDTRPEPTAGARCLPRSFCSPPAPSEDPH